MLLGIRSPWALRHHKGEWFHKAPDLLARIAELLDEARLPKVVVQVRPSELSGDWVTTWDCPQCRRALHAVLRITGPDIVDTHATHAACGYYMAVRFDIARDEFSH